MAWLAQVVDEFSSKSFRLVAIAVGIIPHAHALDFTQMIRQEIESAATHLELLCLVVLTNSIREDSEDTIREVQQRCLSLMTYDPAIGVRTFRKPQCFPAWAGCMR